MGARPSLGAHFLKRVSKAYFQCTTSQVVLKKSASTQQEYGDRIVTVHGQRSPALRMAPPPYGNQAGLQGPGGGKWGPIGSPPQRVTGVPQLDSVQTSSAPYYPPPTSGEPSLNAEAALTAVGIGGVNTSGAMNATSSNQGYSGWLRLLDSHAAAAGAGVSQEWANHAGQVLMHSLGREGKGDRFAGTPSFGPPMNGRPIHGEGAQGNVPHDDLVDRCALAVQMSINSVASEMDAQSLFMWVRSTILSQGGRLLEC